MISQRASQITQSVSLAISAQVKEMKAQGEDVVGFGAGEPDFDTPEVIKEAAILAIQQGKTKYTPTPGIPALREEVSIWLNRTLETSYSPSQVLVSTGAKQCLYNIMLALLDPGDEVILPAPYWLSYPEQIKMAEAEMVPVMGREDKGFKVTANQVKEALTDKTKLLLLNSPSNPTGAVYSREELEGICQVVEEAGIYLLSDEIYSQLVYGAKSHVSPLHVRPSLAEKTIVINGASKAYAMTGWRLGFAAGPQELISAASRIQSHSTSGTSSISQYAALAALQKGEKDVERMAREFARRRDIMYDRLSQLPQLVVPEPEGAFYIFPKVSAHYGKKAGEIEITDSLSFAKALLEKQKVAVVPGAAFGADECLRFSYATSPEVIQEGMDRLRLFLESLS